MNGLNWIDLAVVIAAAIIAALVLWVAVLIRKNWQLSEMLTERTSTIIRTVKAEEHTAIPYSRFLHPPSQPLNTGRPAHHSAPISMPLNQAVHRFYNPPSPPDPWADYDEGNN